MNNNHDKLATRLAIILTKLNNSEKLTVKELADEFNVSTRTIIRDLHNRMDYLPIARDGEYYYLEAYALGKLNYQDIKTFASLSGVKGLYPSFDDSFIVDLLNDKLKEPLMVKAQEYEDIDDKSELFKNIQVAIVTKKQISYKYNGKQRTLEPYKLVNNDAIWYLVGSENNILKTYTFSKIEEFNTTNNQFQHNDEFLDTIKKNEAIWFSQTIIEVVLKIDNSAAQYFTRRKLLPKQKVLEKHDDYIIVSTKVSYEEEILKVVRYWMPHIEIVSPVSLKDELLKQLGSYGKS